MKRPDAGATVVAADARNDIVSPDVRIDVNRWSDLATASLVTEGASGELTLTFIDEDDMAELNEEHMGQVGPTDVLSFPMHDEPQPGVPLLLGDVVVSPAVAARQCADHAGTIDDEIALLVVHGVLHVLGHDHDDPGETTVMRAREMALLEEHHWNGPAPAGFRQTHD